jgi:hypothetical protein
VCDAEAENSSFWIIGLAIYALIAAWQSAKVSDAMPVFVQRVERTCYTKCTPFRPISTHY